jgi:hypothetical protein
VGVDIVDQSAEQRQEDATNNEQPIVSILIRYDTVKKARAKFSYTFTYPCADPLMERVFFSLIVNSSTMDKRWGVVDALFPLEISSGGVAANGNTVPR